MNCAFDRTNQLALRLGLVALMMALSWLTVGAQQNAAPDSSEYSRRGIELYRRGETKSAIKVLTLSTKHNKTDGEAWYYLGLALTQDDQINKARKAFETATKLRPDFGPGHAAFSYVLLLNGKTKAAGTEARRALELNDQLAEAHYVLGVVYLREQNYADAELESNRAIKIKPTFPLAHLLRYHALLALIRKAS